MSPARGRAPTLDAAGVDVYRDAHAMVLLVDQRKRWTLEYAQRQLQEAPPALPVLLASNFSDIAGAGTQLAFEWDEIAALVSGEVERTSR